MSTSPYYNLLLLYAFFIGTVILSNLVGVALTFLIKLRRPVRSRNSASHGPLVNS